MSIVKLYAVRDSKVDEYNQPFCFVNDIVAKRALQMSVNDRQRSSMMTDYPADYDLYCIGQYDTSSAEISSIKPVHVCNASSLVVQQTSPAPVAVPPQAERRGQRGPRVEQTSLPVSGGK